jgi:PAS domain S-box-containing protein
VPEKKGRRSEALLQADDLERWRFIVEAAPIAIMLVDDRGQIAFANAQAHRMFGYAAAELLGTSVDTLVPDRFGGAHPALRDDYLHAPASWPLGAGRDLFGLHKDGREIPIEIGLNPITTTLGDFVLASIIDITERRQAEDLRLANAGLARYTADLEELNARLIVRDQELRRYRLLADVTQDIILFIDRSDLSIFDANAAALKAYGYERSELIGKPLQIRKPDDVPIDPEIIRRTDNLSGAVFEMVHQRSDGTLDGLADAGDGRRHGDAGDSW